MRATAYRSAHSQTPETHSHHVVTFHIRFIFIFTLVVKLAEEIEGNYGVKVHHHSQQAHRHHELAEKGRSQGYYSQTEAKRTL